MKEVFQLIDLEARKLAKNTLFVDWLNNDAIPVSEKFLFTPLALDFVMGFRDLNKYFIRYLDPKNTFERAINAHAREDETHSVLLLSDWVALGMDSRFPGAPRDLLWWLTCDETEPSRRIDFELVSLMYHNSDPLFRFTLVESMEAAGKVFFTRTAPLVDQLGPDEAFPYYGKYHLERETGHLQGADERPLREVVLTPRQRAQAGALVARVFELFDFHFTAWAGFARAVHEGVWLYDARAQGRASGALREDCPWDVTAVATFDHPTEGSRAVDVLNARCRHGLDQLWRTPAFRWIREIWPGDFRRMARIFLLLWIADFWACGDYFKFDTIYPDPSSPLERGINRLSILYGSEMRTRYVEWERLQLDEYTRWKLSDTIRHFWLDERVEQMRAVFAELRKLTFRHPEPLYRYWIMKCFMRFADALSNSHAVAMRRASESSDDFAMPGGQPERMHPDLPADPEADDAIASLEQQPLTAAQVQVIEGIITATHSQEMQRSAITWEAIKEHRFQHFDQRWIKAKTTADAVDVVELIP
jgi:hypothetical protein